MGFDTCPRCGFAAYERLRTHAYCANCNYSPEFDYVDDVTTAKAALNDTNVQPVDLPGEPSVQIERVGKDKAWVEVKRSGEGLSTDQGNVSVSQSFADTSEEPFIVKL